MNEKNIIYGILKNELDEIMWDIDIRDLAKKIYNKIKEKREKNKGTR